MSTDLQISDIPYLIRPMQLDDIDGVLLIEQASFPLPWPAAAFQYDLTRNQQAHYFVVTPRKSPSPKDKCEETPAWWQRIWHGEVGRHSDILGYAGFWRLVDEAHIANIAVAPAWRRRGLGELLLVTIFDQATQIGVEVLTLEVRISNKAAQQLYRKYGFDVVGERRHYYSDSGEDALIMTTDNLTSMSFQQNLQKTVDALRRRLKMPGACVEAPGI